MKPQSIALALAFCLSLVSTSLSTSLSKFPKRATEIDGTGKAVTPHTQTGEATVSDYASARTAATSDQERCLALQSGKTKMLPCGTRRLEPAGESDPYARAISATPGYSPKSPGAAYGSKGQPTPRRGGAIINAAALII
jgi:hypothetical protein